MLRAATRGLRDSGRTSGGQRGPPERPEGTLVDLRDDARSLQPDLVHLRRELHRDPEVGLDLPRTVRSRIVTMPSGVALGAAPFAAPVAVGGFSAVAGVCDAPGVRR